MLPGAGQLRRQTWEEEDRLLRQSEEVSHGNGLSKAISLLGKEIRFKDFGNPRPAENQDNRNERKEIYNSN